MKALAMGLAGLVSLGLTVGNAVAFSCPRLAKEANEAIAKAEPLAVKATEDKQKARDRGMIDAAKALATQAEASHAAGKHGLAEAQAKAAKFLAEQVR